MDILNVYQTAFLATVFGTVLAGVRAKRRALPMQIAEPADVLPKATPVAAAADVVKERIRQLDKLFDDNLLTVDEYVELRRRAGTN